ncbi:MAG: alpha-amylase [Candidatus Lokiarchaeota archaeon]|nr:alpha-amylase [Candidatus Lokiarchaeota archaeon]
MAQLNKNWVSHPNILEINTIPWLNELSEEYHEDIKLNTIPDEIIEKYLKNFNVVWLMGVWERSPTSKRIASEHLGLQEEFHKALDDFREDDIIGSPYAIHYYHIDTRLGGNKALVEFREKLAERNIKLMLDYVPNHVAIDHLWMLEKSNVFIQGTLEDLMMKPDEYFSKYGVIYAHGRDPNFPSWTDTVQINAFSPDARNKTINTLLLIAEQCDAVRCDMAMLLTNDIFKRTWKDKTGNPLEKEFWIEVILKVKEKYPDFKFIAEVYWDMEWDLIQQGFDFCYDKRLYDRIAAKDIKGIKDHLKADMSYQKKLVRFIENHDEQRSIKKLGEDYSKIAALLVLTLPGMGFLYEGQMKGYNIRVPVQLKRRPIEEINKDLFDYYKNLLSLISKRKIKSGNWELCEIIVFKDSNNHNLSDNIIAYHWWDFYNHFLIILNLSNTPSKGYIKIPSLQFNQKVILFEDMNTKENNFLHGEELNNYGYYAELLGWESNLFELRNL